MSTALPPQWPSSADEAETFALTTGAPTESSPRQQSPAQEDTCWWRLSGDIDHYAAQCLQDETSQIASDGMQAHLDLSGVTFIDAGGVGLLATLRNQLDRRGGGLFLEAVTPRTERILRISGAGTLLRPEESVDVR